MTNWRAAHICKNCGNKEHKVLYHCKSNKDIVHCLHCNSLSIKARSTHKGKEMTLIELVNDRLHQMFVQIAEDIAAGEVGNLTPEEAAGAAFALFSAEEAMRKAFRHFVTSGGDSP